MQILLWILGIAAVYFLLVFAVLRLVAPFMGFKQYQPPKNVPPEILDEIAKLENSSAGQKSYLQAVYNLVLDKTLHQWKHTRFKAGTRLHKLFIKDLFDIWQTTDFVYCQAINYVAYAMLVKSKFFKAEDVKVRHAFVNFVIHQYLQVKVGQEWIDFDPAGTGIRGKPLGTHLSFFG